MSRTSFLLMLMLGIVFIRALIAVVPAYFAYIEVGVILDSLQDSSRITAETRSSEVARIIGERLKADNVDPSQDALDISRSGNDFVIEWQYETRRDFLANIDLVLSFEHYIVVER